jgi:hypothetical protein
MIKLALAIGFLAVFGLAAVAIVNRITRTRKDSEEKSSKQNTNQQTKKNDN